jgi:hypothetical protein
MQLKYAAAPPGGAINTKEAVLHGFVLPQREELQKPSNFSIFLALRTKR